MMEWLFRESALSVFMSIRGNNISNISKLSNTTYAYTFKIIGIIIKKKLANKTWYKGSMIIRLTNKGNRIKDLIEGIQQELT